jgi:pyruvate dehydrogenase E2 component (dihydrolipoamide acetyltransferase)
MPRLKNLKKKQNSQPQKTWKRKPEHMAKLKEVLVPDIGNFANVEIIEILVQAGDSIAKDQSLLTLESDKAAMEIPAPEAGIVRELLVKVGDKISQGEVIAMLEADSADANTVMRPVDVAPPPSKAPLPVPAPQVESAKRLPPPPLRQDSDSVSKPHASPAVRKFARELGVNLGLVQGSGRKGRISKEDVQSFVKGELAKPRGASTGFALPEIPEIDFSEFGEIDSKPLSRIKKISGATLHRNWLAAPHVTQHDEADISELEEFRKSLAAEADKRGVKMTPLVFLMKAAVGALKQFPTFNASLATDKDKLILKKYFHIGVAVDTPDGLVVPVVRNADQKGLFDIAAELRDLSAKARDGKLAPKDMQGGCFTISSLGGIGGGFFTPVLNLPEVAIMGVSRSQIKPVWQNGEFLPRLMLPLSLSYDHRVIDGAEGARFISYFSYLLSDVRRLLL